MAKNNKVLIPIGKDKTLYLNGKELDEEIQVDDLLQIDLQNLTAEIVTFPVAMNKVGQLLAVMNSKVAEAEVNLRTWQSKKREEIRIRMEEDGERSTESKVEDKMRSDSRYLVLKKYQIKQQKYQEYINNLFWAMKSKDDKLNKLSLTLQGGDVSESLVNSAIKKINGVNIKVFNH